MVHDKKLVKIQFGNARIFQSQLNGKGFEYLEIPSSKSS